MKTKYKIRCEGKVIAAKSPRMAKTTGKKWPKWMKEQKFFTHLCFDQFKGKFNLSEMRSGASIASSHSATRKDAEAKGLEIIKRAGRRDFAKAMAIAKRRILEIYGDKI